MTTLSRQLETFFRNQTAKKQNIISPRSAFEDGSKMRRPDSTSCGHSVLCETVSAPHVHAAGWDVLLGLCPKPRRSGLLLRLRRTMISASLYPENPFRQAWCHANRHSRLSDVKIKYFLYLCTINARLFFSYRCRL